MSAQKSFTFKDFKNPCNTNRRRTPKRDASSEETCKTNKRVKLDFGDFSKAVTANSEVLNQISDLANNIKASHINVSALKAANTSNILEFLCIKYGFTLTTSILSTLKHVPINFPHRNVHVKNILGTITDDKDLLKFVDEVLPALSKLADETDTVHLTLDDSLLWKATEKHSEPHNLFLIPPVELCRECNGPLHGKRTTPCTVYTLDSGPVPALKATFRCNKCSINYHVDGYTDNKGMFWYEQSLLRRASKFAYCTEDVFEWICESR